MRSENEFYGAKKEKEESWSKHATNPQKRNTCFVGRAHKPVFARPPLMKAFRISDGNDGFVRVGGTRLVAAKDRVVDYAP